MGGIVTAVNQKVTKNNQMMAFAVLEDLYGEVELIVFSRMLMKDIMHCLQKTALFLFAAS